MSTTHFIDGSTPVVADWLNDVDEAVYVTLLDKLDSSDIGVTVQAHSDTLDSVASVEFNTLARQSSPTGSTKISAGTTAQRDVSPEFGWQRANSTNTAMEWWNGSAWVPMGGGATGSSGNNVFFENDQMVTADYTITTNKNAMTAGPVTINSGVTVTVPPGSTWTVV